MGYLAENVDEVVRQTLLMQDNAASQGLRFAVVLLPSLGEATVGARYSLVDHFAMRVRARGVEVVDAFAHYDERDFFLHNGHFDASGARKTAQVIVDWFEAPPTRREVGSH